MDDMQPGQVIIPHDPGTGTSRPTDNGDPNAPGAPQPERPEQEPGPGPSPAPTPVPPLEPAFTVPPVQPLVEQAYVPEPAAAPVPAAEWEFHQEAAPSYSAEPVSDDVTWTASEFIAHDKSAAWYGLLALVGVAAAALGYLVTKDMISTGAIVLAAILFGVFAARKPRILQYSLNHHGMQVGTRVYNFQDFKNFSIAEEGAIASIVFMPLKRFMPPLTIYLAPELEERVVGFLSDVLPLERHKADAVDSLLRRIHF